MTADLNVISYLIYLPIMVYITIRVGWLCYKNGEVWTMELYNDVEFVQSVNRILLLCYYLVNIGYVLMVMAFWQHIENVAQMVYVLSTRIGGILLLLAILHYCNIAALSVWHYIKHKPQKTLHHGK